MSFRQRILYRIKQCQINIIKHDSVHLIYSEYYFYGALQIKKLFKNSVLDIEFSKWQIKIKKHGLGHTIPSKYNVLDGSREK